MRSLKIPLVILACCTLAFTVGACHNREKSPADAVIFYRTTSEPDTLDPQIAETDAATLITNLFEGLVRRDADGQPVPGVAKDWTVSEDGTTYTFFLREEACWSNGEAVTADDCAFGLQRAIDPSTGAPDACVLYDIQNAEEIHQGKLPLSSLGVYAEPGRLIIRLREPASRFLLSLTKPVAMPCQKAFFTASGGRYGREGDQLISNGAFCLNGTNSWLHGKRLSLRRNPSYHGADTPIPAGVTVMIDDSPKEACQAIAEGLTDCCRLPRDEQKQAQQCGLPLTAVGETVWGIAFQTQENGLPYESLRRALLSSLDRPFILQTLPEGCRPAEHLLPEQFPASSSTYLSYDPHADEVWQKALQEYHLDSPPKLTLLCPEDDATQRIVNNILQTWNELTGTYSNKRPVSAEVLTQQLADGQAPAALVPLTTERNHPETLLSFFRSDSRYSLLSDTSFDALLHTIQHSDPSQWEDTLVHAEAFLTAKGIFYPLYTEQRYYVSAPNVTGIIFRADESGPDFFFAEKIASR